MDLFYLCTEDNPSIVTIFPEEMFGNFYNMITEEPNFTNVLLSGILINICLSTRASSYIDAKLLRPVLVCLSIDTASDFQNNLLTPESEDVKPSKVPYILFMKHAKTQQIALQIVGNMFTTDSEGDVPIGLSYLSLDMLKNICRCAAGLSSGIVSTKSEYSDCISECLIIQELSCSCLQNIFLNTDSNYYTVQQLISVHIVWEGLIASLQKLFGLKEYLLESDETYLEALEAITGCIRVFLQRYSTGLVGRVTLIPLFISLSEISSSKLNENIYGIIAKLGTEPHSLDDSRLILQFLIKGCMSQDLEVVVEALNCFFDIYGEEQYDSLFKEMNIVASMEAGVGVLLEKIRKEEDSDVRENAELAYANLIEYIKYKKEHIII